MKLPPLRAEIMALNAFGEALGRIIRPDEINGYIDRDHGTDSTEVITNGAVAVRVLPSARSDVLHMYDDSVLDPYWNVEIVDDPQGIVAELHPYSLWVYGPSIEIED